MEQLIWETAEELDQKLAQRVRNIRKRRLISQEKLASLSGVSYGSIKRFEATGQISLISLTKIAMAEKYFYAGTVQRYPGGYK